jgi:hypothetical protein
MRLAAVMILLGLIVWRASPRPDAALAVTGADPIVAAAGDIACLSSIPTGMECHQQATSDLLVAMNPAAVFDLGDNQYQKGALTAYQTYYGPTWGRLFAVTHPAPGNHEYLTPGATGYFDYFGSLAGDPDKGYYSLDVGTWHVIVLNSNCAQLPPGTGADGCDEGSPQNDWLEQDLAASTAPCTLAIWHHPRFSSGMKGNQVITGPFWDDLYAAGAEVVLSGHDHVYERFAPQDPTGASDPTNGIREFVVGTGGKSHDPWSTFKPNSQKRNRLTFGVLQLTLHPASYNWQFVPESGGTFTDRGSTACH